MGEGGGKGGGVAVSRDISRTRVSNIVFKKGGKKKKNHRRNKIMIRCTTTRYTYVPSMRRKYHVTCYVHPQVCMYVRTYVCMYVWCKQGDYRSAPLRENKVYV